MSYRDSEGERLVELLVSYVVARSANDVIGCETGVPWSLPTDLKLFRKLTMGHPMIMGRKTFESIGKPLDGRDNIVVTRDSGFSAEGVLAATSKEEALRLAASAAVSRGVDEIMIIGGAEIFYLFEDITDIVYLTEIDAQVEGNAHFVKDFSDWEETRNIRLDRRGIDQYPFRLRALVNPDSQALTKSRERAGSIAVEIPQAA